MIQRTTLLLLLVVGAFSNAKAQSDTVLFEGLTGDDLITQLIANFVPRRVVNYSGARDIMYSDIYNVNDSITCVYTGHRVYVDPAADPSSFVFMNGSPNGITAEHTWPRSKGADTGDAFSDMHHLFPTRAYVNEVRSNYPFEEIDDEDTDFWYINDQEVRSKPQDHINRYSEYKFGRFEPREQHKGNVARAMFHFYTFYRAQADAADPGFFERQRETLCDWHYLDPIDSLEYARTNRIALYQDQKPNPFVLDCTLARRIYCPDTPGECNNFVVNTAQVVPAAKRHFQVRPNPNSGHGDLRFNLERPSRVSIEIVNLLGQSIEVRSSKDLLPGDYQWDIHMEEPGIYVLLLKVEDAAGRQIYPTRFVVR